MEKKLTKTNLLIAVLSLVGAWISYLTIEVHIETKLGKSSGGVCAINEVVNCQAAAASPWSEILSIPLGSWGMLFYFFLISLFLQKLLTDFWQNRQIAVFTFVTSFIASLFSIYLFYISWFEIEVFCPLCILLYLVNFLLLLISLLALIRLKNISANESAYQVIQTTLFDSVGDLFSSLIKLDVKKLVEYLLFICGWGVFAIFASLAPKLAEYRINAQVDAWPVRQQLPIELSAADYSKGDVNSKIQIVEFADYECPACQQAAEKLNEWLMPYEGEYHFVYLNYPLDNACNSRVKRPMHTRACALSVLARCAGQQGKFWPAHYVINRNGQLISDSPANKISPVKNLLIEELQLDRLQLNKCLKDKSVLEQVKMDIERGNQVAVPSTPSIFINGKLLEKASKEKIQNIMDFLTNR